MTRQHHSQPLNWLRQWLAMLALAILAACGGGQESNTAPQVSMRAQLDPLEPPTSAEMKLLVISATGSQPSYNAITAILDQIGVPFDRLVLHGPNKTALAMLPGTLSDGAGNGKYQGIILETGDLPYYKESSGNYPSAMTAAQWQMLWQYQRDFGVRTATMYTRPALTISDDGQNLDLTYGLDPNTAIARGTDTGVAPPVVTTLTSDGSQVFNYLNSANPISFVNAYTYLAKPALGANVTPLLQTSSEATGPYTIASVFTAPDGRQNLAITADSNENLTHALLTGYGVVNWVTKGMFLGQRKVYLSAQPDDFFIADTIWNPSSPDPACLRESESNPCPEYRMNATDYNRLVAWQNALRGRPLTGNIRLEMPFNGYGYNQGYTGDPNNTLLPAVKANPNAFRWISHTWDHTSLNAYDADDLIAVPQSLEAMLQQFQLNDDLAKGLIDPGLRFNLYSKEALVQPVISGLEFDRFWEASQQFGFRHILMDTSRTYDFRPTLAPIPTNTGFYSSRDVFVLGNPRTFIIPRYPTNLFYNVTTPTQWVSEFNYLYGVNNPYFPPPPGQSSWFGKDLTYAELRNIESDTLVRYMLRFNANSWMFHQSNLRAYGGTNASLLSDLLDSVTNKYRAMYNLPILSPSQVEIGQIMLARMAYNQAIAAGLKGRIVYGDTGTTIELINPTSAPVDVPLTSTGLVPQGSRGESYGGQWHSTLAVAANSTVPVVLALPEADLSVTKLANKAEVANGKKVMFTLTFQNSGPYTAAGMTFLDQLPLGMSQLSKVTTTVTAGASVQGLVNTGTSLRGTLTIPSAGTVTVRFEVTVRGTRNQAFVNTATVTPPVSVTDPVPGNNTSSDTVTIR